MSFEEDEPFYHYGGESGNSSNSSNNDTSSGTTTTAKAVRFGLVELGIFIGLWVIMIISYKMYTRYYRKKKGEGWFGVNNEKLAYERLLEAEPDNEEALKKALIRRTMTDVRRLMKLQEDHDSVMSLSRSGALSEDLLVEFKAAEKELELELFEVQAEAETFKQGWSQEIVRDAVRMMKIEDELMEMKKRKEKDNKKSDGKDDHEPQSKSKELNDEEKKVLLRELLISQAKEMAKEKEKEKEKQLKKRPGSNATVKNK